MTRFVYTQLCGFEPRPWGGPISLRWLLPHQSIANLTRVFRDVRRPTRRGISLRVMQPLLDELEDSLQ